MTENRPCYVLKLVNPDEFQSHYLLDALCITSGEYLRYEFWCTGCHAVCATTISEASRFTHEAAIMIAENGIHHDDANGIHPDEVEIVLVPEYAMSGVGLFGGAS